ncbi:hypothetical protein AB0K98_19480 [Streptomyces werraensis]|uniref:hypothetical protein n=1 Tax=Streptomyces werraensis TaxID=68284 RepID=UPI00344830D0
MPSVVNDDGTTANRFSLIDEIVRKSANGCCGGPGGRSGSAMAELVDQRDEPADGS